MDPNPYQPPWEAGYDFRAPATRPPLWRRVTLVVVTGLAFAYVGWVFIFAVLAMVDLIRWQFSF